MVMARVRIAACAMIAMSLCLSASARVLKDIALETEGDVKLAEIRLGSPVAIDEIVERSPKLLRIRLSPSAADRGWSSSEMTFEGDDQDIQRVGIEGSEKSGLVLSVEFRRNVYVELLPQFDGAHVVLKYAAKRKHRRLAKVPRRIDSGFFAVTLKPRAEAMLTLADIPRAYAGSHDVYVKTPRKRDEQVLRLGFFQTQQTAEQAARMLASAFPNALVEPVSKAEMNYAAAFRLNPRRYVTRFGIAVPAERRDEDQLGFEIKPVTPTSIVNAAEVAVLTPWVEREAPPLATVDSVVTGAAALNRQGSADPAGKVDGYYGGDADMAVLVEARRAMAAQDYAKAIGLFTKARALASSREEAMETLEMLAVAREYNGQLAHAKRLYEEFLTTYGDGAEAVRVRQRLASLVAVNRAPNSKLRAAKHRAPDDDWKLAANVSQFYQRRSIDVNGRSSVAIDGIFNDANLMLRKNGAKLDQEARISLSYVADFSDRMRGRTFRASTVYWDGYVNRLRTGVRIGRQNRHGSGVLGRFDGLFVSHDLTSQISLGAVAGYSVDSTFDNPSTERPFYGVSAAFETAEGGARIEPFLVQQYVDGILDRRAVGMQAQMRTKRAMVFSLVDYDVHFGALNNLTVMSNVKLSPGTTLNAAYDFRRSPYLTTRNALIGQPYDDLTDLEREIVELELRDIAVDRTASNQNFRLGLNSKLGKRWSLTADVTAWQTSATTSSANVLGFEARDGVYYSLQVRSTDVFGTANFSSVTVRRSELDTSSTTSVLWNNRFVLGGRWYLQPRMRYDYRTFDETGQVQTTLVPTMRVDYRHGRRLRFEVEAGYEWTTRETAIRDFDISGLFIRAGYRALL